MNIFSILLIECAIAESQCYAHLFFSVCVNHLVCQCVCKSTFPCVDKFCFHTIIAKICWSPWHLDFFPYGSKHFAGNPIFQSEETWLDTLNLSSSVVYLCIVLIISLVSVLTSVTRQNFMYEWSFNLLEVFSCATSQFACLP